MVLSKAKTVSIVFRAELDEPSGVFFAKTRTPPDCVRCQGGVSGTLSRVPHELLLL